MLRSCAALVTPKTAQERLIVGATAGVAAGLGFELGLLLSRGLRRGLLQRLAHLIQESQLLGGLQLLVGAVMTVVVIQLPRVTLSQHSGSSP